jgi:hypothetical protein
MIVPYHAMVFASITPCFISHKLDKLPSLNKETRMGRKLTDSPPIQRIVEAMKNAKSSLAARLMVNKQQNLISKDK